MQHASMRTVPLAAAAGIVLALAPMATQSAQSAASAGIIETVVISAQRIKDDLEAERALTPGGVTVVDGAKLYQRSVTSLADMLRYVPGIWAESSSGSDELFFSSRGSNLDATDYDKNGIKLLQDGLPVTTADGNNHNRVADPLSARYAVVARGANALTYGASTLGGAIDFASATARNSAPLALFVSSGSHGQLSGRVTVGGAGDAVDGLVTVEAKEWNGYRRYSAQQRVGIYANGAWQPSPRLTMRMFASHVENDEELPGALTRNEVADQHRASSAALGGNYQKNVEAARLALKTTWIVDPHNSFELGLSHEEQSLYHPIVDKIMVGGVEVFSLLVDTEHRNAGATLRHHRRRGHHDLLMGLDYGHGRTEGGNYRNDGGRRDGLSEYVRNRADSLELYLVDRWNLAPDWIFVYGAQWVEASRDVRTLEVSGGDVRNSKDEYSAINPRLGVIYALNEHIEVFASISRLFETPTAFEMEDDTLDGNATLDAMHGVVYEAGARSTAPGEGSHWRWDISAYWAQIRDEILSIDDPATPGNSLTTNIERTTHAGMEALIGGSVVLPGGARIEPLLSLTLNQFSFDSDPDYGDNALPAAPKHAVRGEVLYRSARGFYVGPTWDLVGRRYADFRNTYRVRSYGLLGLRAGVSSRRWEIFGEARNLLDQDYIATLSVLNEAHAEARVLYPGAPLSVYAGARLQFGF